MPLLRPKKSPRRASLPLSSSDAGEISVDTSPQQPRLDLQQRLRATTTSTGVNRNSSPPPRLVVTTSAEGSIQGDNSLYFDTPSDIHRSRTMSDAERLEVGETREPGRHRDSIVQRVAERLNSPTGEVKRRKSRRSRRLSTSSALSQGNSIAAALAKSGLQLANASEELPSKSGNARTVSNGRSPYLLNPHDCDTDDGYGTEDESAEGSEIEGIDHLPVTGFAVASNRRNAEFHAMFPTVDDGDYLIEGEAFHPLRLIIRLRLCVGQRYSGAWEAICFRESYLLPFKPFRMGNRREYILLAPEPL